MLQQCRSVLRAQHFHFACSWSTGKHRVLAIWNVSFWFLFQAALLGSLTSHYRLAWSWGNASLIFQCNTWPEHLLVSPFTVISKTFFFSLAEFPTMKQWKFWNRLLKLSLLSQRWVVAWLFVPIPGGAHSQSEHFRSRGPFPLYCLQAVLSVF